MTQFYIPVDSTAISVGADSVARTLQQQLENRQIDTEVKRISSRGLFWLEPLLEIDTPAGRMAYGPVTTDDVDSVLEACLTDGNHDLQVGLIEQHPYLVNQQRLCFSRLGQHHPLDIEAYQQTQGFTGLRNALSSPDTVVQTVTDSGLRGRGGAAFPTGIKWQTVATANEGQGQKYIVANADEGDSGTFSDRMLMENDPYTLIEGMTIAGIAVGATQGYIYLRSEYPHAHRMLNQAIEIAQQHNLLGTDILGSGLDFHLEVRLAAGAYICGEETSLLESLEGRRGLVRSKPPLPALEGLFGQPTVVNNVITLASVPYIMAHGAQAYADFGMGRSRGTMPIQLAGNIKQGGLVEVAFGTTLRELIYDYGGGTASGRPVKAVQVGGPLGAYLTEAHFDTPFDYEAYTDIGGMVGHGGIVVFDDTADMGHLARFAMEFCAAESCGKCTPCRLGSTRAVETIDKLRAGEAVDDNLALLNDLCDTMISTSLCALGGMAPYPVQSVMQYFPHELVPTSNLKAAS